MELPGFSGQVAGRSAMIAGFEEFCAGSLLRRFQESDFRVSVIGDTAIATHAFDMDYVRQERSYRATGRDLWVLAKCDNQWLAVWRTIFLDMHEVETA